MFQHFQQNSVNTVVYVHVHVRVHVHVCSSLEIVFSRFSFPVLRNSKHTQLHVHTHVFTVVCS